MKTEDATLSRGRAEGRDLLLFYVETIDVKNLQGTRGEPRVWG